MVEGMTAEEVLNEANNEALVEIDENEDDPEYNPLDNWLKIKILYFLSIIV